MLVLSGAGACVSLPGRDGAATSAAPCPPGAEAGRAGCACRPDLLPVLGACVPLRIAAAFCGPTAQPTTTGCAPRPRCDPGRARDLASGACMPRREVRAIAVGLGILVGDDELVGCPDGGLLVADGPSRLGCIAEPVFSGQNCAPGTLPAATAGTCKPIFDGKTVDVAEWSRAVTAGDSPPLCVALTRGPAPEQPALSLVFPDNDVSLVRVSATAELEAAVAPMLEALRSLGGTASQAAVSVRAVCKKKSEDRPAVLTPENDHEK